LAPNRQSSNRLKRDFSFSLTTLSLNFIFIFFTLPICVYLAVISDPNYTQTIAYLVLDDLYYLGYSVSVIIYSISNRMFREELRLLILKTYGSTAASWLKRLKYKLFSNMWLYDDHSNFCFNFEILACNIFKTKTHSKYFSNWILNFTFYFL
jgi:hypothetical protein